MKHAQAQRRTCDAKRCTFEGVPTFCDRVRCILCDQPLQQESLDQIFSSRVGVSPESKARCCSKGFAAQDEHRCCEPQNGRDSFQATKLFSISAYSASGQRQPVLSFCLSGVPMQREMLMLTLRSVHSAVQMPAQTGAC